MKEWTAWVLSFSRRKRGFQNFVSMIPWDGSVYELPAVRKTFCGFSSFFFNLGEKGLYRSTQFVRQWSALQYTETFTGFFGCFGHQTLGDVELKPIDLQRGRLDRFKHMERFCQTIMVDINPGLDRGALRLEDPPGMPASRRLKYSER